MSTITINGNTYSGNSIVVSNGKVIIDGKDATPKEKTINISVQGNIHELNVDSCDKISVEGSARNIKTMSGDVRVTGDVQGNIQTMSGDIGCGIVYGSVSSLSGDILNNKK
jgi:hypothetical protein